MCPTAQFTAQAGRLVPEVIPTVRFSVEGPGEIVATDHGDAANLPPFAAPERAAFNGRCLGISRRKKGHSGPTKRQAQRNGLAGTELAIAPAVAGSARA